jgi:hypothetical protein
MEIPLPSRKDVAARLEHLRDGSISREEASDWARYWYLENEEYEVQIDDWGVWNALEVLFGCDSKVDPETYLYGRDDFEAWLTDLALAPVARVPLQ